jgi:WhiB family redox-sensing transcriptional regulator
LFAAYRWQRRAACADADPLLFFHPDSERGPERRQRDRDAVAVCSSCPVIAECRAHGLAVGETYGVWGGLTEDDRVELTRGRRHRLGRHRRLAVAYRET